MLGKLTGKNLIKSRLLAANLLNWLCQCLVWYLRNATSKWLGFRMVFKFLEFLVLRNQISIKWKLKRQIRLTEVSKKFSSRYRNTIKNGLQIKVQI